MSGTSGVSPLYDVHDHRTALAARNSCLFSDNSFIRSRNGGARRVRTDDLKLAKLALSQLSYGPDPDRPPARFSERAWWAWEDLNFRPHAYQARALTN